MYGLPDKEQFVGILVKEFGAAKHPHQADAYIVEGHPFYFPRQAEDHLSVLSFNNAPLPDSLIAALMAHAELFSDDILVR